MKEHNPFPYRYYVVTFVWTWIFWLSLALASLGILPLGADLVKNLVLPATALGGISPAIGAFYSLRTLSGKGSIANYLKSLLDLRFGWKAWIIPVIVLGGITFIAWFLPELWGEPRLNMLLPSIWILHIVCALGNFFGWGIGRIGLARLYHGQNGRQIRTMAGQPSLRIDLGSLACAVIPYFGNHSKSQQFFSILA